MDIGISVAENNTAKDAIQVSDSVFNCDFNESLVHQVVTAYLSGERAGTSAQKNRSDVRGGGKKPWRQKGTGRARAGSKNSPIWRGGGRTFAARPRDYSQKVNKKMYRSAMRSIFSELIRLNRFIVVESFNCDEPKTKNLNEKLRALNLRNVLVITENVDENLYLASRNLSHVSVLEVKGIEPVSLVNFDNILITVPAVKQVEEWLK